jgi:tetratricopeptide (TPR) repeat protein
MKLIRCFAAAALLSCFSLPVQAENLEHLRQLLSTKQCESCDLSGSGLVMSNLAGARLSRANLVNANFSQADLSGADLSGANLTGASLHGANLMGANLSGAILTGTDLREAYLTNANLSGTALDRAYVEGAVGMPNNAATPELFFNWGLVEVKKGNYNAAMENFNKALALQPEYASAYLGRGYVLLRLGKDSEATQNIQVAAQLFQEQKNTQGYETAQNLLERMEAIREEKNRNASNVQLGNLVQGIGGLLLKFLPALL